MNDDNSASWNANFDRSVYTVTELEREGTMEMKEFRRSWERIERKRVAILEERNFFYSSPD